ncbi:MAG TPA: sulfatase-like hydrolase/transferase, partial [Saprospiraceae bacterium]|nr:sulfatase-like hydrolase/transferase [Saprospiraceae bacterium]
KKLTPPTTYISKNDYTANFEDFLDKSDAQKPWFFWMGFEEPHRAYEYKSGITKGGKKSEMIDKVPAYYPDVLESRIDLLDYAMEIEYMDSHIVKTLETLKKKNLLDNTLIVVTSDHGMPFPRVKGNQYENANHIPMAIMWQGKIKTTNRIINDYVNFTDLAPTFLEIAGITEKKSGMRPIQGKSILPLLFSNKSGQIDPKRNYQLVGQERHDFGRPNDEGY